MFPGNFKYSLKVSVLKNVYHGPSRKIAVCGAQPHCFRSAFFSLFFFPFFSCLTWKARRCMGVTNMSHSGGTTLHGCYKYVTLARHDAVWVLQICHTREARRCMGVTNISHSRDNEWFAKPITKTSFTHRGGGFTLRGGGITPKGGGFTNREGGLTYRGGGFTHQEFGFTQQGAGVTHQGVGYTHI
jgi:hypothetical protein